MMPQRRLLYDGNSYSNYAGPRKTPGESDLGRGKLQIRMVAGLAEVTETK
jgi:hypothetical protein